MQRLAVVSLVAERAALGIWVGALCAFAFLFAPQAFRVIAAADVGRFAALIGDTIDGLTRWGYALGGLALVLALANGGWPRAALAGAAIALTVYHQRAIIAAMRATADVTSPAYHALHAQSTRIYGAALLCAAAALIAAAAARTAR